MRRVLTSTAPSFNAAPLRWCNGGENEGTFYIPRRELPYIQSGSINCALGLIIFIFPFISVLELVHQCTLRFVLAALLQGGDKNKGNESVQPI